MSTRLTFICDSCEKQYLIDQTMDIPPHWFAVQYVLSDKNGLVPSHEREVYYHFCSQECAVEHAKSPDLKERSCMVDREMDENDHEEDPDE